MSQENAELFHAYHAEIARSVEDGLDPEATISKMAEYWDPEVEYDLSESPWLDIRGIWRGKEDVSRFWREWFAAWQTFEFHYEVVDAHDRVVVLLDTRMRGRSTGIEVPGGKSAFVTTFRDGRLLHNKLYMSQSEALEAVGLSGKTSAPD